MALRVNEKIDISFEEKSKEEKNKACYTGYLAFHETTLKMSICSTILHESEEVSQ